MEKKVINNRYCYDDAEIRELIPETDYEPVTIWITFKPKKGKKIMRKRRHSIWRIVFDHMYKVYKMEHDGNEAKFYFDVLLPFAWWTSTAVRNKNTSWAEFKSHGITVLISKFKSELKIIICRRGELHVFGKFYSKE